MKRITEAKARRAVLALEALQDCDDFVRLTYREQNGINAGRAVALDLETTLMNGGEVTS